MQDIEDRVIGVLLGLAAGDRIGGPIRMALHVAESLHECGGVDVSDIGLRYLDWWRNGAFDTGPTADQVLSLVNSGISFEQAVILVDKKTHGMSAGCNPAHRSAPLAMHGAIEDAAAEQAAIMEARLTHGHPLAGETAAAVVYLCRSLIRGASWTSALNVATKDHQDEIRAALASRSFQ